MIYERIYPITLALCVVLVLPGCWGIYDRNEQYRNAETIERVRIPDGLDHPPFEDALNIPEVRDVRNLAGSDVDVGLPEGLATSIGVDQIVIKRLGEVRWVFVDAPPAMVWPRLAQFWDDNGIDLVFTDPSRGLMESDWVTGRDGDAETMFESFTNGTAWTRSNASKRHKFRLRVEPGIRNGSTEIYVEHKSLPLGVPVREDSVEWATGSDDGELEGVALNKVAYYLGDTINTSRQISKLASNIGGQRTVLVPDEEKPVLKYKKLKFERAWVTVRSALEEARIDIEEFDRNAATYSVYYDDTKPLDEDEPGFFMRLFTNEDENVPGPAHRYLVRLDSLEEEEEVHVTVLKDATTLADALVAERLLTIIKQYST